MLPKTLIAKLTCTGMMNTFHLKKIAVLIVLLTVSIWANAQHCDDCSVNINGPSVVHVGETVTYTVMVNNPGNYPYEPVWNSFGHLYGGEIIDQGIDAYGHQFCTIYFYQAWFSYLDYEATYNGRYDYDEIPLYIYP